MCMPLSNVFGITGCGINKPTSLNSQKDFFFGKHLSNVFKPHSDITLDTETFNTINHFLDSHLLVSLPAKPTSPNELQFLIKKT